MSQALHPNSAGICYDGEWNFLAIEQCQHLEIRPTTDQRHIK